MKNPCRSLRLAGKSTLMELDESDSDHDHDEDIDNSKRKSGRPQKSALGQDTADCLQSLSSDLKSVHAVLDQLHKLASGPRRSKDLALVGMQDEIAKPLMTTQRLQTN